MGDLNIAMMQQMRNDAMMQQMRNAWSSQLANVYKIPQYAMMEYDPAITEEPKPKKANLILLLEEV